MTKNLLFINPYIEDFTAYNLWAMPLGLFRIMEYFEKSGANVTYLDFLDGDFVGESGAIPPSFRSWGRHSYWKRVVKKPAELNFVPRNYYRFGASDKKIEEILSTFSRPDGVFISSGMTYWYRSTLQLIDTVRKIFGNVEISVGGIAATLIPQFFRQKEVFVQIKKFPIPENVTGTGINYLNKLKFFPANIVEGCPYRCPYCASALFYPEVSFKNSTILAQNLEKWHEETALCDVAFYDDALLLKKGAYLKQFLNKLEYKKYRFHTPNGLHLNEVDDELCDYFTKYNFPQLRFGFETAFTRYEDKTNLNQLIEVVKKLKKHGFTQKNIGIYLLCGLPGQTVKEVMQAIEIVAEIGAKPYLNEFSPIPGTALYEKHLQESKLNFDKEPLYQNNSLLSWRSPIFVPEKMKKLKEKLNEIYAQTESEAAHDREEA